MVAVGVDSVCSQDGMKLRVDLEGSWHVIFPRMRND